MTSDYWKRLEHDRWLAERAEAERKEELRLRTAVSKLEALAKLESLSGLVKKIERENYKKLMKAKIARRRWLIMKQAKEILAGVPLSKRTKIYDDEI